jgi:hypothetical protein
MVANTEPGCRVCMTRLPVAVAAAVVVVDDGDDDETAFGANHGMIVKMLVPLST